MTDHNVSDSASSAERSPFQGTQYALARKPLPGPAWAWPVLGVLVAAGLIFLVTRSPAEHAAPRAAQPEGSTPSAEPDVSNPTLAAVAPVTDPAPAAAPGAPTPEPTTPAGVAPNDTAAAATAATDPPKASDATEPSAASASPAAKKKARAAARRASRKRSARTP